MTEQTREPLSLASYRCQKCPKDRVNVMDLTQKSRRRPCALGLRCLGLWGLLCAARACSFLFSSSVLALCTPCVLA